MFFALGAQGSGISGSDRIFIEFARVWSKKYKIEIFLFDDGKKMCERNGLRQSTNLKFNVINRGIWSDLGFAVDYLARIVVGVFKGITLKIESKNTLVYSASEFWMDSLPCFILKLRHSKIRWIAAWYQTAPNPLKGFSGGRYKLSAFYYWLMQKPIKPLISKYADFVLVNNDIEKMQFPKLNKKRRVVVVLGAVDLDKVKEWKSEGIKVKKIYDAVFQGRFHPQKGVVELMSIWKKVVEQKPDAKLVMIGDGPLRKAVEERISRYKLENNIKLSGFLFDGPEKYKIFSQSKIVLHPAFYDSGGMASAEAMAFGLPCVGFDLPAYKSYYPKGMVKVKIGDLQKFANNIIRLLKDSKTRNKLGIQAKNDIQERWSWGSRAKTVLNFIIISSL